LYLEAKESAVFKLLCYPQRLKTAVVTIALNDLEIPGVVAPHAAAE
jgi:hypothetical protein